MVAYFNYRNALIPKRKINNKQILSSITLFALNFIVVSKIVFVSTYFPLKSINIFANILNNVARLIVFLLIKQRESQHNKQRQRHI